MSDNSGTTKKGKKHQLIALSSGNKSYTFDNPLERTVKYMGEQIKIRFYEDPRGFSYILWKNKKFPVDIIEKKQNKYTVMLNGVWHTFTVETPFSLKRRRVLEQQAGSSATVTIEAPMPGKIVEVLVEEGAEITQGEPVLILEAMKMQNEIASHVEGIVQKISVKNNDSVMKDDLLMEIKRTK